MLKYLPIAAGLLLVMPGPVLSDPCMGRGLSINELLECRDEDVRKTVAPMVEADRQREEEYERTRSVQVLSPEGTRTYYPSSDGHTWTSYDARNRD